MRFIGLFLLVSSSLLLNSCASSQGFWKSNRFDRNGRATGRWRTYYDANNKELFTAGRYRHGRPVGTFQYYDATGKLDRSEHYERQGFCEVTYWYPGGQVARKGHAQWVTGKGQSPRFYWYGPWTSYDANGQITSIQTYTDGKLTRTETYQNGQLTEVETLEAEKRTRVESYAEGQLIKVETFERGLRTGTTNTL